MDEGLGLFEEKLEIELFDEEGLGFKFCEEDKLDWILVEFDIDEIPTLEKLVELEDLELVCELEELEKDELVEFIEKRLLEAEIKLELFEVDEGERDDMEDEREGKELKMFKEELEIELL